MTIEQVPAAAWRQWVAANDAAIVDVRRPEEWAQGTLPGAELIPLGRLPAHLADFDQSRPMLIVCRTGSRSNYAATWLRLAGFSAANLAGGMKALGQA